MGIHRRRDRQTRNRVNMKSGGHKKVVSKRVVLVDVHLHQKRNEGSPGCSLGVRKIGTRAQSPKPPFCETALLFALEKWLASHQCTQLCGERHPKRWGQKRWAWLQEASRENFRCLTSRARSSGVSRNLSLTTIRHSAQRLLATYQVMRHLRFEWASLGLS